MFYRIFWVLVALGLASCSPDGNEPAAGRPSGSAEQPQATASTWREERIELGRQTYDRACASCHETGEGEAPVTGKRDDWAQRSDMWQAVLARHAKSGYLEMPGKGGQADLTDESVDAATEYMLGRTFPELLRD